MAHLPKHVQDIVTPFLRYYAQRNDESLHVFNLEAEMAISGDLGDADDVHGVDILNRYQYWFISSDCFNAKLYSCLDDAIKKFNQTHKKNNIQLHLSHILACAPKHIICHSDSDHYGSYYFLINVTDGDNKHFNYMLPAKIFEEFSDESSSDEDVDPKTGKRPYNKKLPTKESKKIKLPHKESKIKYALVFGGELEIIKQSDDIYLTKNDETGEYQTVFLSDDYYRIWQEEYSYRDSIVTIDKKKEAYRKLLDDEKKDTWLFNWRRDELEKCELAIEKYGKQYTPWVTYDDPEDHLSDLAKLLIKTDVDSSDFQLYLTNFINLKKLLPFCVVKVL
jgi:hypothetical protein